MGSTVTKTLCGEELRLEVDKDELEGPMMRFAEAADSGDLMKQLGGAMRFLRLLVVDEDQAKLNAIFDRPKGGPRFADIEELIASAMKDVAGHPTERPSPSPSGPPPTGQKSRVVSLSPATDKTEPPSAEGGVSAAS